MLKERELQLEMKKKMEELRKTDEDDVKLKFQTAQDDYHRVEREKVEKRIRFVLKKKNNNRLFSSFFLLSFRDRANLSQYHLAQFV